MSGPVFHWDLEQNTSEWIAARMAIPTASSFGKIITPEGKRSSQSKVYLSKLLWEFISGLPLQEEEDPYESAYMQHGHEYEENTVAAFEFVTGHKAEKIGGISNWDGMIWASPDRIVRDIACAEMKSPQPWTQLTYWFDKELLPKKYKPQLQGQLIVGELDKQFICSDHPKCKVVALEVGRDESYITTAKGYLREFVDELLEKRLILEREFGKPKPHKTEESCFGDLGVSMDDVEAIIAANNRD